MQSNAQAEALETRQADLELREEAARQTLRSFEVQQKRHASPAICTSCFQSSNNCLELHIHPCLTSIGTLALLARSEIRLAGCRGFAEADARKQELQLRDDRTRLKEAELASLEQSTRAGLKTAQKKVMGGIPRSGMTLGACWHGKDIGYQQHQGSP